MERRWQLSPAVLAAIGVLLLGGLAYFPSLDYPYLQDAVHAVQKNPVVARGDLVEIFASDYWKDTYSTARTLYRPVAVLSFALELRLAGEPGPFLSHLFNLLLHQIVALLLFAYGRRLGATAGAAIAVALLFTVHPLLLQGVANVVGRADLLALLFSLGSLLALSYAGRWRGGAAPSPPVHRIAAWSGAGMLFVALASKEIAWATPILILLQELLCRVAHRPHPTGFWRRRVATLLPCALAGLIYLALRTHAIGVFPGFQAVPPEDNVIVLLGLQGSARVATALSMAARYAGLLFFPASLSADYSGTVIGPERSLLGLRPVLGSLFLFVLILVGCAPLLHTFRRAGRAGADSSLLGPMGAWIFLLPYLPISNLLVLNAAGFAERLIYVPAAGFCLIVVALTSELTRRIPAALLPLAVLLGLVLGVATLQVRSQARMWESTRALFERSLESTPKSIRFNMAMAHFHRRAGNIEETRRYFERNVEQTPEDSGSWSDLGIFLAGAGELDEAERVLREAIRIQPQRGEAHAYLGAVLRRTARAAEAERSLRKALLLRPDLVLSAAELGDLLFESGRFHEAAFYYRGCVRLGRTDLQSKLERAEAMASRQ